jgi:hypothetical protein
MTRTVARRLDSRDRRIGVLQRLYREAASECIVFVDVVVGGLPGLGTRCFVFPWENLVVDPVLHGYRASHAETDQIARIDKPYVSPQRLHGRWSVLARLNAALMILLRALTEWLAHSAAGPPTAPSPFADR